MPGVSGAWPRPLCDRLGGGVLVIRLDDALDEIVAHDVALVEID